jgi:hypothetical protein
MDDNSTSSQEEGALVTSGITSEGNRIECDFALWKGIKPGELFGNHRRHSADQDRIFSYVRIHFLSKCFS